MLRSIWIPESIYKPMPYITTISGLFFCSVGGVAVVIGLPLFIYGAVIFTMRF